MDSEEPRYGGFWIRLGAMIVDGLIFAPLTYAHVWSYRHNLSLHIPMVIVFPVLSAIYHVCCVKIWGGTPGKLLCGLQVVTTDFRRAGWREAMLREAVMLALTIVSVVSYLHALSQLSHAEFYYLDWLQRGYRLDDLGGLPRKVSDWLTSGWMLSELVVLLLNRRRRALHDFVAGTVIIRHTKRPSAPPALRP